MRRHVDDASAALYISDPEEEGGLLQLLHSPIISEQVEKIKKNIKKLGFSQFFVQLMFPRWEELFVDCMVSVTDKHVVTKDG